MEGAPGPVTGPRSPRSSAHHFFFFSGFSLSSLHFFGGCFPRDGDPLRPPACSAFGGHGIAHTGSRPGETCSVPLAGVGRAPSLLPKNHRFLPQALPGAAIAAPWVSARLGEMYPGSVTSPVQACCIYAVIFQLVSRKCLYTELPTAVSRAPLILLVITIIVLMRRVAGPAVTSCSWPAGLWVRCITEQEQIDLAHGSHHLRG